MQKSRAGLFLMELTISLLFFAIASAVCIQLFVRAHSINKECEALSKEHNIATNIAETYRAGVIGSLIPGITDDEGRYVDGEYHLYYGDDRNISGNGSSSEYVASLRLSKGTLDIEVTRQDDPDLSYSLSVYRYFPGEVKP